MRTLSWMMCLGMIVFGSPAFGRTRSEVMSLCTKQVEEAGKQLVLEDCSVSEITKTIVSLSYIRETKEFSPVFTLQVYTRNVDGAEGHVSFRGTTSYRGSVCRVESIDRLPAADLSVDNSCDAIKDGSMREFCHAQRTGVREDCRKISDPKWQSLCQLHSQPDPYSCENVADENFMTYCYALTSRSPIGCFQILDRDMEFLCYGHVLKSTAHCGEVQDANLKQLCLGLQQSKEPPPRPMDN